MSKKNVKYKISFTMLDIFCIFAVNVQISESNNFNNIQQCKSK